MATLMSFKFQALVFLLLLSAHSIGSSPDQDDQDDSRQQDSEGSLYEYMKMVTDKYKHAQPRLIEPELPDPAEVPMSDMFLRPIILIWDPPNQYPGVFPGGVLCPTHNGSALLPRRWRNTKAQKPRKLCHLGKTVILIGRKYECTGGNRCSFLTTDKDFVQLCPAVIPIPFMLFYRTGLTKELKDFIISRVFDGAFLDSIRKSLETSADDLKLKILKQFWLNVQWHIRHVDQTFSIPSLSEPNVEILVPSDEIIRSVVLDYYTANKYHLRSQMRNLEASWLSCNHNFKTAGNFGEVPQEDGSSWTSGTTQSSNVFTMQNEHGQVMTWVPSRSFDCVRDQLKDLVDNLDRKGKQPKLIIIDDCCQWRGQLQEVFGEDVEVKLDLFHAVQRISKCVNKRHIRHADCLRDLRQVFVQKDDLSDINSRREATPQAEEMRSSLEQWFSKWKDIKDKDKQRVLNEDAETQVYELLYHIDQDCLSRIPPGCGTNQIARLHEFLNHRGLAGRRIGPELAEALWEIHVFMWNKKQGLKYGSGMQIKQPEEVDIDIIISNINNQEIELPIMQSGFDLSVDVKPKIPVGSPGDSGLPAAVLQLLVGIATAANMVNDIKKRKASKAALKPYMMYHLTEAEVMQIMNNLLHGSHIDHYDEALDGHLRELNLQRCMVPGDGDCLFASFRQNLLKLGTSFVHQHLGDLELPESPSALDLRKLFVDYLIRHKTEYEIRSGLQLFDDDIKMFLNSGIYDTDIGDFVLPVLVDATKISVTVVTPIADCPLLPYKPTEARNVAHMYIAFSTHRKHYDAVSQIAAGEEEVAENYEDVFAAQGMVKPNQKPCCCGRGEKRKLEKPSCVHNETYRSRCPCLAAGVQCLQGRCKCKSCHNPYGNQKPADRQAKAPHKRQRKLQQVSSKRVKSVDFMNDKGCTLEEGSSSWTTEETILLAKLLNQYPSLPSQDLRREFNDIAARCKPGQNIRIKSVEQFNGQLKKHQSRRKLVLDFVKKIQMMG